MKQYLYYIYWLFRTWPMRWSFPKILILSFEETIDEIIKHKKSISRFGDGEFRLLMGERDIIFQKLTSELSYRLTEVIKSNVPQLIIAIPESFRTRRNLKKDVRVHWLEFINSYGKEIALKIESPSRRFGNAFISRFYQDFVNKKEVPRKIALLKKIWQNQDILFVEGEFSRLGIGNDLFSNAKSIHRIICPSKDAFEKYDEIFETVKMYGRDKLIILALGPTATVLSYDLAKDGFWALDLGHIDIEYSWFLQNAQSKGPVKGKKSAEVTGWEDFELGEEDMGIYKKSIIAKI